MAYCKPCDRTHATDEARVAGSRFTSTPTFQAHIPGAPIRTTRAQAQADLCQHTQRNQQ